MPVRTLYMGGGGDGAPVLLESREFSGIYRWISACFSIDGLQQSVAEVDFARVDPAKAGALAEAGVDRVAGIVLVAEGEDAARSFGGIRFCRKAGIRWINVDLSVRPGQLDVPAVKRFLGRLRKAGPDSVHFPDAWRQADEPALKALVRGARPLRRGRGGNIQLERPGASRRHLLGLGWGALSNISGGFLYEKNGGLSDWVRRCAAGRALPFRGAAVDARSEMRGFIIGRLADSGHLGPGEFKRRFGVAAQEAFPGEFRRLARDSRAKVGPREIRARPEAFMEIAVLRGLSRRRSKPRRR